MGAACSTPEAEADYADPSSHADVKAVYGTYALELKDDEENTRSFVHPWVYERNKGNLAAFPKGIVDPKNPATQTIPYLFANACTQYATLEAMGSREILESTGTPHGSRTFYKWKKGPFVWDTFGSVGKKVKSAAASLYKTLDGQTRREDGSPKIAALLAETSAEWMMGAQAALACGMTITTVYTTLGHEAMLHGLQETEAEVIFVDWEYYEILKDKVLAQCPALKQVVIIGKAFQPKKCNPPDKHRPPFPLEAEFEALMYGEAPITTLDALIKNGDPKTDLSAAAPKGDDLAIIMYTSGSTGTPKGVMLTHKNFVSTIASCSAQDQITMSPGDTLIGYLPLAHIFEMICEINCLLGGGKVGYSSVKTLTSTSAFVEKGDNDTPDLPSLQPTHMAAVPAVLDTIASGLKKKMEITETEDPALSNSIKQKFQDAVDRKMHPEKKGFFHTGIIDNMVFNGVKGKAGLSNCKILISGGAPLAAATQDYIEACFCPVAQGYGATETTACTTVQEVFPKDGRPGDVGGGRVGAIQPNTKVKLTSCDEMGYLVTDPMPRGEILIAGNSVAMGYYKMEEKTAEDFVKHSDGLTYFHTGDIGKLHPDGVLQIIDRKKDLIKLEGGEYVSLGKVEANLKQVKGIAACVVFCQSSKKECVCIVSQPPNGGWASVGGKPEEEALLKDIAKVLKGLGLASFEIPKKVKVDDEMWTPESGLVTAALKLQRNPLRTFYNGEGGLLAQMDYRFE
jgi:long-chain acyl-CoA synthetase